jgi:hypothetical protein
MYFLKVFEALAVEASLYLCQIGRLIKTKVWAAIFSGMRYKEFHRFGQAKFPDVGLILGWIRFSILP